MNKILHWLTEFHKFLAFYILLNLSLLFLPYLLFIKGSKSNDESYLVLSFVLLVVVSPNGFRGNIINFLIQYKRYFTYTVIVIFLTMGWYFAFGEKNYSDCILNHVKSTGNESAVYEIKEACELKY